MAFKVRYHFAATNVTQLLIKCRTYLFVTIFLAIQVGFAHRLFSQKYIMRRLTPDDGLASVQVRKIVQDKFGYIWIASRLGVSRYDGYNFKIYRFDSDTLGVNYTGGVVNLKIDREGNVWVFGELLSRYDSRTDDFVHFKPETRLDDLRFTCFSKDGRTIWFGKDNDGLISYDLQTKKTTVFVNHRNDSLSNANGNSIWGISDRDTYLLLATRQGIWNFDKQKKIFTRPICDPKDTLELYQQPIWELIEYPNFDPDDVWLSVGGDKMARLDRNLNITQQFKISSGYPFTRDNRGIFWFSSPAGFYYYNPRDGSSEYIHNDYPETRAANQVFVDREQIVWLGTESLGLFQLVPKKIQFRNFSFNESGTFVTGLVFQTNGIDRLVLIRGGSNGNQLWTAIPNLSVSMDSVTIQKAELNPPLNGFIISSSVGNNKLHAIGWSSGLMTYPIDPATGSIGRGKMFAAHNSNPNSIRPLISHAYEDSDSNLWSASRRFGVSKIVNGKLYGTQGSVIHYLHNNLDSGSLSGDYSLSFHPEDEKSFWVINWNSVDLFRNGRFEHVFKHVKGARTLIKISTDTLFVGTFNGFYEAVKRDNRYNLGSCMLPMYTVYDMAIDGARRLWFADPLHNRMVCYDRKRKIAFEFSPKDGFPEGVSFIESTSKGAMVLGTTGGVTLFDPLSLEISEAKTFPVLTQLKVNNQITSIQKHSNGNNGPDNTFGGRLVLDYQHNNFELEFSAMEMTSPEKNLYRYKLEAYDKDWIETDWKNRTATYTNLEAGEYLFRVKASNHNGIWSDQETTLRVVILPPPWRTWWAYTCYGLALIGIFMLWRRYDLKRVKLKHRAEHLSELDNLKTRFFTNISHEFRTPITLIQGPLKEMYGKALNKEDRSTFAIILRNAQRLSMLINQLLDLSKLEAGKMTLHACKIELVQFLREMASSYESLAANKNIKYFFYAEVSELMVYIDGEKIEKVVHNLLSNAFKFTSEGEIALHLKTDVKQCIITVKDTGIGIPADQLDKVFDRFYQVDSSQTRSYEGSGLGMALAKELVELHHGTIRVESIVGKGTAFTVSLRLGKDHLNASEIIEGGDRPKSKPSIVETFMSPDIGVDVKTIESSEQPILLIVEDNADMRHYIHKTFSDNYQIIEAVNGKDGLSKAEDVIPDLIISDVMMPEMDGYKFCEYVKSNEKTSHVPVILLTAKADSKSKIAGLETGADDYLSKPFDAEEIKLIVKNRIEQRRKIRERFSRVITLEPQEISITSFDEKFLNKVMAVIEERMSDENFSIDELGRLAGYSNMHFYRKIKALSGATPSQFLRTIRLKRAAELLKAKSDNVTQIAYSVGFNSLSYFNKCFKEQFGVTPGQFTKEPLKFGE